MFKLYAIIVSLAFLASQTRCFIFAQDNVVKVNEVQSSDKLVVNFRSSISLLPGIYTQELIVQPGTCSIRIDFNDFTFRPPVQLTDAAAFVCALDLDVFELIPINLPKINLSALCGKLSGQHIYLPTKDQTTLLDATVLGTLNLRATYLGLDDLLSLIPKWDITLTQIPCKSADAVNSELSQLSLPPAGCLQYHTELKGTIESFNLVGGSYFGDLNYAICFKQSPDTCGIKLLGVEFELSTNGDSSTGRDCDTAVELDAVVSRDYLVITERQIVSADGDVVVVETKYCGNSLLGREIVVKGQDVSPIAFVSDSVYKRSEFGFRIDFEILTDC